MNNHLLKIMSLCLVCVFTSCSDAEMITNSEEQNEELVTITFSCGGELVNVVSSPMTKAGSSDDLYLFVFFEYKGGDKRYVESWLDYGYIFTDNPSSCQMSFRKNKEYLCNAICVPNGKNLIAYENGTWGFPFKPMPHCEEIPVLNKVSYGTTCFDICYGSTTPKGTSVYSYASENKFNSIDKYFGFKSFTAESDASININLYRMMFSISLNITNFTEGKIKLFEKHYIEPKDIPSSTVMELEPPIYLGRGFDYSDVSDYDSLLQCYSTIYYNFDIIDYIDKNGNTYQILKKDLEIKRITNYEISFDLEQVLASDNMGINANLQNEDITNNEQIPL